MDETNEFLHTGDLNAHEKLLDSLTWREVKLSLDCHLGSEHSNHAG